MNQSDQREAKRIVAGLNSAEGASAERTFRVAAAALYRAGKALGYDAGKLNNGGIMEALVAMQLGLRHSTLANGADAFEETGRGVELKNSVVYVSREKPRANFVFAMPRRTRRQTTEQWLSAVRRAWTRERAGGCLLVATERGEVARTYRLSAAFMAAYFTEHLKRTPTRVVVNLGCERCARCHHYHRAQWLEGEAARFDEDPECIDWQKLFARRVRSQCRPPSPKK